MTFQEAADLAGDIRPGLTVPAHFDMFAMNSVDPHLFADYMAVKHSKVRTLIPDYGQTVIVERSLNSQSHY
jgi:L-ascorbate metabolism protein UlaG (beta-lactamase superfamily)